MKTLTDIGRGDPLSPINLNPMQFYHFLETTSNLICKVVDLGGEFNILARGFDIGSKIRF